MAFDAYIKIDGAEGQSQDNNHSNWIDVDSFSFGSIQNLSAGRTVESAGRGDLTPFIFTHVVDKATPKIQKFCASGNNIAKVEFNVCQAIKGKQEKVLEVKMENVKVVKACVNGLAETGSNELDGVLFACKNADMMEEVHMVPGKITWKTTPFKPDGSKSGAVEENWDQIKNN
jgi:type VI secretion system secreted protein Hcp